MLRGLPFTATEDDIAEFLKKAGVTSSLAPGNSIVLLSNNQGRPSGFAEISLADGYDFGEFRDAVNMRRLGTRYIEVLPPNQPKWGTTPTNARAAHMPAGTRSFPRSSGNRGPRGYGASGRNW